VATVTVKDEVTESTVTREDTVCDPVEADVPVIVIVYPAGAHVVLSGSPVFTVTDAPVGGVTDAGLTWQPALPLAGAGVTSQLRSTVSLKPPVAPRVIVAEAFPPGLIAGGENPVIVIVKFWAAAAAHNRTSAAIPSSRREAMADAEIFLRQSQSEFRQKFREDSIDAGLYMSEWLFQ
jgi:hypothetical protein